MRHSWRSSLVVVLLSLATAEVAVAQAFNVASQNTLHFGWGLTGPNSTYALAAPKTVPILNVLNNGAVARPTGVLMLQEVMRQAQDLGYFVDAGCVGSCSYELTAESYGRGWYQERYGFIINAPAGTFSGATLLPCSDAALCARFSRPPAALQVNAPGSENPITFLNFHAIWGQRQAQRIAEAGAMNDLLATMASGPVIVGADWNLPAATVAEQLNSDASCVEPDGLTTLNLQGNPSSSYDHFYVQTASDRCLSPITAFIVTPGLALDDWRDIVSDHQGIVTTLDVSGL